jgi:murein L,D-transpeptidase YcbB/YkuD
MRVLKLAATSSLAALVLALGAGQVRADHDGWWDRRDGMNAARPRQNAQPNWWEQPRYAPPPQRAPSGRYGGFNGWFQPQPQAELPRSQNIEPEAAPAKAPVIYTYRPDPLVDLADANLTRSGGGMLQWGGKRAAKDIFEALKSGSSGVRVTEQQRAYIIAFYSEREFAPIWVSGRDVTERAGDVLSELAEADQHGLSARDYLPADLGSYTDDLAAFAGDRERLARLELALTAAALRYAMHASGGRIVPDRISAYHDLKPPTVDGREALTRLAEEPSPGAYLASLHPVHPAYEALRREFVALSASTDRGEAPIAEGPAVKPGETDARLPAIRSRLAKLGHLSPGAAESNEEKAAPAGIASAGVPLFGSAEADVIVEVAMEEGVDIEPEPRDSEQFEAEPGTLEVSQSETYDAATVDAVKAFQAAAGLTVDGIIGQNTISAFNSGNTESRIERLAYSLERLRWMPRDFGAKYVFVNTASFETRAVENGTTIWSSKVIVGTPQNQTVSFSDQFETVVFNPYWGVPASIIVNEFAPEMRRDPSWIDREGYEVTDLNGQVISPYNVDWYSLNPKNLKIGVRQPPGPKNALGEIKFLFPNEHAIYMHDTPSKPLFAKPMRAYSHGCVRVENPREFAEIILGWDRERIASTLATARNQSVPVDHPIKVHIAYFTAWPDETGAIRYFDDVYGRDQLVERALGTLTVAMAE